MVSIAIHIVFFWVLSLTARARVVPSVSTPPEMKQEMPLPPPVPPLAPPTAPITVPGSLKPSL